MKTQHTPGQRKLESRLKIILSHAFSGQGSFESCDIPTRESIDKLVKKLLNWGLTGPLPGLKFINEAEAQLSAEAGTVATETGFTPRQLAEQRAELLAAAQRLAVGVSGKSTEDCEWYEGLEHDAWGELSAAIAKAEQGNADEATGGVK